MIGRVAKRRCSSYSCDCSDALLKLGVRHGGFLVGPTMWSPKRQEGETVVVGPAYTVQYALLDDPTPKLTHHYVSRPLFVAPCTVLTHGRSIAFRMAQSSSSLPR